MPQFFCSPRLRWIELFVPVDGIGGIPISASVVVWSYHVNSTVARPPNSEASKPASISSLSSGPRSGLPKLSITTAGCSSSADVADHSFSASNAPGALPERPHAARSLKVSKMSVGQNDSSEIVYVADSFGYVARPKPSPNVLKPSQRTPAVRKILSWKPICSCRKKPPLRTRSRFSKTCGTVPSPSSGSPGPANSRSKPLTP